MNKQILERSIQPPPLFPKLEHQVNKQSNSDAVHRFIVDCAVNFTKCMQSSPFYIKPQSDEIQIERYSDKFKLDRIGDDSVDCKPLWDRLPAELSLTLRNPRKKAQKKKISGNVVWNDKHEKQENEEKSDEEDVIQEVDSEDDDQGDYGVNHYEDDPYNQDEENIDYDN